MQVKFYFRLSLSSKSIGVYAITELNYSVFDGADCATCIGRRGLVGQLDEDVKRVAFKRENQLMWMKEIP